MQFRADEYFHAGLERMRQATRTFRDDESFALAMYCGGLAVECMLRAFRTLDDDSFDERHDLMALLKGSRLLRIDEEFLEKKGTTDEAVRESRLQINQALNEVVILWHNSLRFTCERSLKAHLRRIGRIQGVRGNPLKKNARDLLDAAQRLVDRGTVLWMSRKKS
jgi:hypothetical protein